MVASRIVTHDDRVGQIKKYILVAKELYKVHGCPVSSVFIYIII